MAVNFNELKGADSRTKYLVRGYIRSIHLLLPLSITLKYNIPELINQTCLMFYGIEESWDFYNLSTDFEINNNIIKKKIDGYQTAYLSKTVSSGIHHWRFKIISKVQSLINNNISINGIIDIGIWKVSLLKYQWFTMEPSIGYAYNIISA